MYISEAFRSVERFPGQSHIKTSWLELTYFLRTASFPPVVRKEVIAKLIAFVYLKSYQGRDQDLRNNPHNFLYVIHLKDMWNNTIGIKYKSNPLAFFHAIIPRITWP
jgi:hypothetical protein